MQGHIEVLIGARGLPSIDTVFGAFPKKAAQAAQAAQRELNRQRGGAGARGGPGDASRVAAETRAVLAVANIRQREISRVAAAETRATLAVARMRQREEARFEAQRIASEKRVAAEKDRFRREEARAAADRQRAIDRQVRSQMALANQRRREEAKAAREANYYERSFAYRTGYHGIIRYAPGALHRGARFANDILHGAGIEINPAESIRRTVEWQAAARPILNQAGTIGENLPKEELYKAIREGSTKYGYSREAYTESIAEFARLTGSPHAAMSMSEDIAKRAAGSNATLEDMMAMGGDIYSHLGEHVKDKKAATLAVIDAALLQGEKGGVNIGNLARGFAKIGGSAGLYEGGEVENMKTLGALAQLARKTGGATSAAGALTAIERFTTQLTTAARAKQFKIAGLDIMSKTEHGKIANPLELIYDAVEKAKGDPLKMNKLIMSSVGIKTVRPFLNAYNAAIDHGEDPRASMKGVIAKFLDIKDIEKNIEKNVKDRDEDVKTKAQRFRNKVDDVAERAMVRLLPKLEQLEPKVLSLVDAFGKATEWAIENPGRAITTAIVLSIGRASLESAVRAGLEKLIIKGFSAVRAGGGPGGSVPMLLPPPGPAAVITGGRLARAGRFAARGAMALGAGYMVYQAGQGIGDLLGDEDAGDSLGGVGAGATAGGMMGGPWGAAIGAGLGGWAASHQMIQRNLGGYEGLWEGIKSTFTEGSFFKGLDRYENQKAKAQAASGAPIANAESRGPMPVKIDANEFRSAFPAVQKVEIINLPTAPGSALSPPEVSDAGRSKGF